MFWWLKNTPGALFKSGLTSNTCLHRRKNGKGGRMSQLACLALTCRGFLQLLWIWTYCAPGSNSAGGSLIALLLLWTQMHAHTHTLSYSRDGLHGDKRLLTLFQLAVVPGQAVVRTGETPGAMLVLVWVPAVVVLQAYMWYCGVRILTVKHTNTGSHIPAHHFGKQWNHN